MPSSAPEDLVRELDRLVRHEQSEQRLPSVAAAVFRAGEPLWETAVGAADVRAGTPATPDTQYRIGSITKTFTAVAVLQLRDAGLLGLEDTVERHLGDVPHRPSLRRLLSHTSGLQREPPGDVWETLDFGPPEQVLERLAEAEAVLSPGARFHYSNLAFAVLGTVVERVSGLPYERYLRERILGPAGLSRTTVGPAEPAAAGYLVHPFADDVADEAPVDTQGWLPAGQLWGTVRDLCRWGAILAEPDEAVLRPESAREMRVVQAIDDHERWTSGYGLGLGLRRDGERILFGHAGSMPGFMASLLVSAEDRVGAAVLTNGSTQPVEELARRLVAETVERYPAAAEEWRAGEPLPGELAGILGPWFLEGAELVLHWRRGRLEATFSQAPDWAPPSVFEREGDDLYRTVSGREQGELLRLVRDADGHVTKLYWATYPITRDPRPFGRASTG